MMMDTVIEHEDMDKVSQTELIEENKRRAIKQNTRDMPEVMKKLYEAEVMGNQKGNLIT